MKWEEADARREKRKSEVRDFLSEAGLLEDIEALRAVFGAGVRIDWIKFGDRIYGRDAYEESVRSARRHREGLRRWHERTEQVRRKNARTWTHGTSGNTCDGKSKPSHG